MQRAFVSQSLSQPPSEAASAARARTLRQLQDRREEILARRRVNLLVAGVIISLLCHTGLMVYLNFVYRGGPPALAEPVNLEFAVIHEEQLTQLQDLALAEPMPAAPGAIEEPGVWATLEADLAAAALNASPVGAIPGLGGTGSDEGAGSNLAGKGAAATFFGVASRGRRFAYIVDVSASMADDRKLDVAMQELANSIESLPDYAHFHVVLYSTRGDRFRRSYFVEPPWQRGWTRARPNAVAGLLRWLDGVDPDGGTQPIPAFLHVFELRERPDVIFFLTDGLIPDSTAAEVAELNRRGRRVTVNTIAFGRPDDEGLRRMEPYLKRIARESGGVYRFVSSGRR